MNCRNRLAIWPVEHAEQQKISYQIIELLEHRYILDILTFFVNIL